MPLELNNMDLATNNQYTDVFLTDQPQAQADPLSKKFSSESSEVHNQKPPHDHLHQEENWTALSSGTQYPQHEFQLPRVQCQLHTYNNIKKKTLVNF